MRVAILINKARPKALKCPEEVAFCRCKNVRSNVRELQRRFAQDPAYSRFNQKRSPSPLAREALRDCC